MEDLRALRAQYMATGFASTLVRPIVLESWERCRRDGVDPRKLPMQEADPEVLAAARAQSKAMIEAALPLVEEAHVAFAGTPHVLALSDGCGRILHLLSDQVDRLACFKCNIFEGASWSEGDIGCNGIGTCLAAGRPVVLIGPEHFQDAYREWTCIGIPIRGAGGEILGALDLSVPNEHVETSTWGVTLVLVEQVEALLRGEKIGPRPGSLSERTEPLDSLLGVMALLLPQLNLPPTHAAFVEKARRAVVEALQDRRRAGEKLLANEERYRVLKRATDDVIWEWDIASGELLWSHGLGTVFGYSPGEISLRIEWWYERIHPDDRQRVIASIEAVVSNPRREIWTAEYRFRHADGSWVHVFDRGIVSRGADGAGGQMIGSMIDLTERVRKEEALHLAVQRFETLANMMPQIVWSTTPDGYHDYFNDRWYDFTGMSREEGQGWNWKEYLHPDDVSRSLETWNRSLATGEPYEVQYRFRRASDGAYRWFIGRAMPIYGRDGKITRWFGTCTDIDDQRREEEKLEGLVTERTSRLEEQTRRLRHLAAELVSAEQRERRRLAALLHDDLQQLLVAAAMQIAAVRQRLTGEAELELVEKAVEWLNEAANTARNLSKELRPPALYEGGLLAALRGLAAQMEERHNLKVNLDFPARKAPVSDDEKALLFDCVRELLFNTAKYAQVESASVSVRDQGDRLTVTVTDEGRGFDPEAAQRNEATGVGLFSIRERLRALGGECEIKAAPGSGTRIVLEIPRKAIVPDAAVRSAPVGSGGRRAEPARTDRRTRVLIVDDHAIVREGIAALLAGDERLLVAGQASNGKEAVEFAEGHDVDVVLMDLNMPVMNGIEAAREFRHRFPGIAVIGLSVQDDEATAQAMVEAGAAMFLPKSDNAQRIIASILTLASSHSSS
jgi:PAS domain S-box-containing protein